MTREKQFAWSTSDIYLSDNGKGVEHARILSVVNGIVKMERWKPKSRRFPKRFELTLRFFLSPMCGWRLKP